MIEELNKVANLDKLDERFKCSAELKVGKEKVGLELKPTGIEAVEVSEPDVKISMTTEQFAQISNGELSLAKAYMRGDIKPEGSTRAVIGFCLALG